VSEIPGLIVNIDGEWMSVRVPTGAGCSSCADTSSCSFLGPASAYRTLRLPREDWCSVGQRIRVEEPPSTLAPAAVALVALPLALIVLGRALLECCLRFPFATLTTWLIGVGVWLAALYGTNLWMSRAARFRSTIRPA